MTAPALFIRNVEVDKRAGCDVRIEEGRIAEIGARLSGHGDEIDGKGGALIPGLADHHIHLLSTAKQAMSVVLDDVRDASEFTSRMLAALAEMPRGAWVRAVGYHHNMAGDLTRDDLDRIAPHHPLRVEHQTGSLWILNSLALEIVSTGEIPSCVERDSAGRPTGRIWRGDDWLHERLGEPLPDLAPIGRLLASYGVTSVTDPTPTTDGIAAAHFAEAIRSGALPQNLMLMSATELVAPDDGVFTVGPVKILLDEHNLPDLNEISAWIDQARVWGRAVAVHCVTATELAFTLAAFTLAGARDGDRIEHAGVTPSGAIDELLALGLTVVTQPSFIFLRGERYLVDVARHEVDDLYRCASFLGAGVRMAASSDAPYGDIDPWLAMRVAVNRCTNAGRPVGMRERVDPEAALALFLGDLRDPGGPKRRVAQGALADLCLLKVPRQEALDSLSSDLVRATFVGGRMVFEKN